MRKALYILGQLSDDDIEWMIDAGHRESVRPGTALITQGEPVKGLYLILGGEFSVIDPSSDNRELARLLAGEIVGEMSFVDRAPPSATVRANTDGSVLSIAVADLRAKIGSDTAFAARFYYAITLFLSDRLRASIGRQFYGDLELSQERDEDELDPEVLDSVHLAGDRFTRILDRLAGTE